MPLDSNPKNNDSLKSATVGATAVSSGTPMKASKVPMALKIIVALLIPPLGLILVLLASVDKKRPKKIMPVIVLLIASAVGIAGYFVTVKTNLINVKVPFVDWTKYNYQSTNPNEFSNVSAAGMSFSKPSQFTTTAKKTGQSYSTESFVHFDPSKYPLAYIFTFSIKDSHTTDEKYIKGINDFMSGTVQNSYRTAYIEGIKKQVFDSYPNYNATLSEPQQFTNANIKKNAWSFGLDITNPDPQIKPMKGELVYVLGVGKIYYFSLMVTKENWAPNMAIWQTVLGSLKLNA